MRCPFCGSPDVSEETEDEYASYLTQLMLEGVQEATSSLPYYFCHYCGSHFDVVEISFYPKNGNIVYNHALFTVECPECGNLVNASSYSATWFCGHCGKEFNLVETTQ